MILVPLARTSASVLLRAVIKLYVLLANPCMTITHVIGIKIMLMLMQYNLLQPPSQTISQRCNKTPH